jgi:hypothetical protein
MLKPVFASIHASPDPKPRIMNLKLVHEVADGLTENYDSLKRIVLKAVEWDAYVPSMSAALEYLKYGSGTMPTQFMEAQLDFFGVHANKTPNPPLFKMVLQKPVAQFKYRIIGISQSIIRSTHLKTPADEVKPPITSNLRFRIVVVLNSRY